MHFELTCMRSSHQMCSIKKMFLEISQNSQENTCARVCSFIKKETLAQMFSCDFSEISKNTFFTEHLWTTTSYAYLIKGLMYHYARSWNQFINSSSWFKESLNRWINLFHRLSKLSCSLMN